jgi:hypothetical protein
LAIVCSHTIASTFWLLRLSTPEEFECILELTMKRNTPAVRLFFVVFAAGVLCQAQANTLTIGTTNSNNAFPFTASDYLGEYQQDYNGALFPGPVEITGITFFASASFPATTISGDFTIHLSTTSATTTSGAGGLSDVYAANIGANNTQFFSGTVTNVLSFTGGPFLYNPSQGNLLLDVNVLTPDGVNGFLAAGCSTDTNRVFNLAGNGAATQGGLSCPTGFGGLETEFTFTPAAPVPEPSTGLMLALGLLSLLFSLPGRRRDTRS